jgi:epoxyqueuosine reductase QueG
MYELPVMKPSHHPNTPESSKPIAKQSLDPDWLRKLCLEVGADDVGFVALDREELDMDREDLLTAAPWTKSVIGFVVRMQHENIRSPMRSLANVEFHACDDRVTEVSRAIVAELQKAGVRAMHMAFGFPMETERWPGKMWVISHKKVAEAAGLGKMGIHRNVIHPQFGSFIFLGSVLIDCVVAEEGAPIDYDPCMSCKLCVAACPTGAIGADGEFNFTACYTHNYREFMGGFTDWVEQVADSKNARDYRSRVSDPESVSMWQSLSFEPSYKAAYCLAVCPAGEDIKLPFELSKAGFIAETVKPLQAKEETVYVLPGSDPEQTVPKRFPHKTIKRVGSGLRPQTIRQFVDALPWIFQREQSKGLNAVYHMTFTGSASMQVTVEIREKKIKVTHGHVGNPDLRLIADSKTWLGFLAKEKNMIWAILRLKIRVKGPLTLMLAFGRCFPI